MNINDAKKKYYRNCIDYWNQIAENPEYSWPTYYHRYLERIYKFLIPENSCVLEIGCGRGDLLAAIKPTTGIGVDQSKSMLIDAKKKHPHLHFINGLGEEVSLRGKFDVIILSDFLNNVWDIQALLSNLYSMCNGDTRIIINGYSRLWQPFLNMARKLGLATPLMPQNWITVEDIHNILSLNNFDPIKTFSEIILPIQIPWISYIANRYFAKIFPFRLFSLSNFIIARKTRDNLTEGNELKVSVVVAARNEEGNIADIFKRVPNMGAGTELIFVEGGSKDKTFETIQHEIMKNPDKPAFVYKQKGKGKGDAVRLGFNNANGDIFMILDADMTVPPENLPLFFDAIANGKGEFINGVRLVYPMEQEAMRFFNLIGNKFFSLAFSWLLGQSIKDTLCGTKVLTKNNYDKIAENRRYFGEFDPFGDFDLIFGAAKLNLKIIDLPIRYRKRLYGDTNISRWQHGMILLRMVAFATRKIKFF